MRKKAARIVALAMMMTVALTACSGGNAGGGASSAASASSESAPAASTPEEDAPAEYEPTGAQIVRDLTYGTDYVSLYEQFGKDITTADVTEDPETGFAYINVDGTDYELGLDFLTMAMVYNAETEEEYADWWKWYITRWNYLLPEVPLYSNEYYDVYNAKIKGVEEYPTNPFWGPQRALIDWTSEKDDNSFIYGNTTTLSGKFRYATFGANNPGAADNDISFMVNGLEIVGTTKEGSYEVNPTVTESIEVTENDDGTATYTIKIYEDLVFSDGSPITAKNYLYFPMVFSTPVAAEAAGKNHQVLMQYAGYEAFAAYDGTNDGEDVDGVTASKVMSGVRLIDDYTFSVTIKEDYWPYFYAITLASFSPTYKDLWMGQYDIADDGEGVYIEDGYYEKNGDSYVMAQHIVDSSNNTDTTYPYSGPYVVESYDQADTSAVLKINPNFKGNYEGTKPSIETIVYKRIVSETQLEDLRSGGVDMLAGITGGAETDEAIALADTETDEDGNPAFVYTHYSRAGYGKLGMRCDFGPVQFEEVRQAIAYCMDRATFAKDFTGGYGGVVDGPYYTGSWMYQMATSRGMMLDSYDTSVDSAIEVLEAGGWIYDAEGNDYTSGVRYKKIPAEYMTEADITFQSVDGAYTVTQVGDDYYMPLALNWFGTDNNEFSTLLVPGFEQNDNIAAAGFVVQKTIGEFQPMLDELYQAQVYGYYSGTPLYTCFNFATGFNSAVYDYAFNMTVDPSMYDDYSIYYIKDAADIYLLGE